GVRFAETENVAVGVLDVEIEACPGPLLERADHLGATRLQLAEQALDPGDGNVRVQVLVLFAMCPLGGQFGRELEVYREAVAAHAGVERFVDEIDLEAEPVTVERNRSIEVVDEELRGDPGDHCSAANRCVRHLTPRRQSCRGPAPGHRWRRSWAVGTHAMSIAVARARRQHSNSPWFGVHVRWLTGALDGRRLDSRATGRDRFGRDRCPSRHNAVGCLATRRSARVDEDDRPRDAPLIFAFYLSIQHMSLTIWILNNYASWAVTADFLFALCLACASESP